VTEKEKVLRQNIASLNEVVDATFFLASALKDCDDPEIVTFRKEVEALHDKAGKYVELVFARG